MAETLVVACPSCGKKYRIKAETAGKTVKCAACQQPFVVEAPPPEAEPEPQEIYEPTPALAPPPGGYQPVQYSVGGFEKPRTSGVAIASLVCGCLFCVPLSALAALILGIIGLKQTKENRQGGRGMAIAGAVLGSVGMTLWLGYFALLISILLPSLNRAREVANRVKCASNMRQIGQGMLLYANDNKGQYPPDLATLMKAEQLDPNVFICPSSNDTPGKGPEDLSGNHLSYTYVGQGLTNMVPRDAVVMYEKITDHNNDGTNVLFGDGHVDFVGASNFDQVKARSQQVLQQTNGQ
jgi:predicted Zn finger-like uncharacterized protein/prepilin-type processing-associated H-X9-DG protein